MLRNLSQECINARLGGCEPLRLPERLGVDEHLFVDFDEDAVDAVRGVGVALGEFAAVVGEVDADGVA